MKSDEQKARLRLAWKRDSAHALPPRPAGDEALCRALAADTRFASARRIALFSARASEPDLSSLWRVRPQAVYFPRVVPGTFEMEFFRVNQLSDLRPGFAKIPEPPEAAELRADDWGAEDLVLVPGIAFDRWGGRVGSGLGFYDRFLGRVCAFKCGVAWSVQIVKEKLAQESTDVRMDGLVTEKGFKPVPW